MRHTDIGHTSAAASTNSAKEREMWDGGQKPD